MEREACEDSACLLSPKGNVMRLPCGDNSFQQGLSKLANYRIKARKKMSADPDCARMRHMPVLACVSACAKKASVVLLDVFAQTDPQNI